MSIKFKGIAASDGIGIAKAYLLVTPDLSFRRVTITDPDAEIDRLHQALDTSVDDLKVIKARAEGQLDPEVLAIFDVHIELLTDPEMIKQIEQLIKTQKINAEQGLKDVTDRFINTLEAMKENRYMQERAADVRDITKRVLSHLLGKKLPDLAGVNKPVILVAHEVTPSDTSQMNKKYIKGIVTDLGGRTSHSAIMSRTLEIPAVVGTGDATQKIKHDDTLILDGLSGVAISNPTETEVQDYQKQAQHFEHLRQEWAKLVSAPSVSADGKKFEIASNIGTPTDLADVSKAGADAVGLFRSEFLYMDSSSLPTEEEQYKAYKRVVKVMNGKPVVIRTMDIGGDKSLSYLHLPKELNPFLGYRAIRISLQRQAVFRTQLRALIRASKFGQLRIMFPMIATLEEFRQCKAIFIDEKKKLQVDDPGIGDDIKLGIMVEVPAAAIFAEAFAKEVDFFSIGTNDLIQYTFAADRGNECVSYLYQPYNPGLLKLIKHVIDAAHQEGKTAAMCGEMAGDAVALPLLMGMGLDEYSMSSSSVLRTRSTMKSLDTTKCAELVEHVLNTALTNDDTQKMVKEFLGK
ncbi:phosphoenolpyruvate-protein phosphotransferase [Secundilactobacillus pentosiphilus]|uniref:Phosphoenolpyruvate-protein phosphotransferase n=1 Tax=Secundilactobacillus pentosiphilus TaxID=1714682 RepID=A0A1Z5IPJ2_9LACO|nr:phosphoenolpyruvate--protein phosphotransferase [Secundilactobacillus pentosiphilus]GAX03663.1 phosphoenolpyruvate-protein phosphotransferase [Secundilactobacillus pentosiphilus]